MSQVRQPAVAGMFYPAAPAALREIVERCLSEAAPGGPPPKALIVPHAGYVYSGPVAGSAYALLREHRDAIRRVVLLGPSHRVGFPGLALPASRAFRTPLGDVPVDPTAAAQLDGLPQVSVLEEAHALEHSLEVHLPFLQSVLGEFTLVALVVGDATPNEVSEVLERLWGGPETLVVVSSDLSHYHDYAAAVRIDARTSDAILARRTDIGPEQACGCRPINGLLQFARNHDLAVRVLDRRNSGDTAGPRDRVVGYGAYALS